MKALVYHGPGHKRWEDVPNRELHDDTDAIVRVDTTTICGTDLHILKGDVPEVTAGRILGHEAVGTVERGRYRREDAGARRPGPRLVHLRLRALPLLPRGPLRPVPRRRRLDPRHLIDGTQAEFVRVPFADTSTYQVPDGASDEEILMLADILPTGYEVGVLNGRVQPGDTVAVVGAGPIGLSAILGAKLYLPEPHRRHRPGRRAARRRQAFGAD